LGQVIGETATDNFCFDKTHSNLCVDGLKFLLVDQTHVMDSYKSAGFIGMSPEGIIQLEGFLPQVQRSFN
jgi:hypothetical protein